ncbi:hypothetical protein [Acinetobacter dispersus]|uniref:Uncharacterized protein n=1 Tax=Acinetobacter dispersus TaxID=70348 RepID=N9L9T6_9GAMM|nr:hypothetical protein [Acinetobacter dispersus]ENW93007.1 hypothetical protein F904_02950 [Acinetobacter dispersus]
MSDFKDFSKKATKDNEVAHQVQANEHTQVDTPNSPQSTPKPDDSPKPQNSQEPKNNN